MADNGPGSALRAFEIQAMLSVNERLLEAGEITVEIYARAKEMILRLYAN